MRLVWAVPLCLATGVLVSPDTGFSEAREASKEYVHLISDSKSEVINRKVSVVSEPSESTNSYQQRVNLPSLKDLGLSLDSTDVAKRNELESVTVQPWTPGRGAVGVKLEVSW